MILILKPRSYLPTGVLVYVVGVVCVVGVV